MPSSPLARAPGTNAAKVCGILAIVSALTCAGIPVAVILGIVALVQYARAKGLAAAKPEAYAPVPATGLVTGVVGLVVPVVVVGIALPALQGPRIQAADKYVIDNLRGTQGDLVGEYGRLARAGTAPADIPDQLGALLKARNAKDFDPWDSTHPAMDPTLYLVAGSDPTAIRAAAEARAVEPGVIVFILALPDPSTHRGGWLAGACRIKKTYGRQEVFSKIQALD